MTQPLEPALAERIVRQPACFSAEEWQAWTRQALKEPPSKSDWACSDCTPEFKARMTDIGCCDWPCVEFVDDGDGGLEGKRMSLPHRERMAVIVLRRAARGSGA